MRAVVLELNSAFGNNALDLASSLEAPATQATSSAFTRFSDLLASAESESSAVQEEAPAPAVIPPLPSADSRPNSAPGAAFQNGSGSSNWNYSPPPQQQQTTPVSSPATAATPTREDTYYGSRESSGASGHSASLSKAKDTQPPEQVVQAAVTNGKTIEKPKQRKSEAGGELTQVTPASNSNGGSATATGAAQTDPATVAPNANIAVMPDNGEINPALTPKARNSKSGDTDSALAFAVRIQGMNCASSGSLGQTNATAAADPANPDAQTASPFAAELAAMLPVSVTKLGLKADGGQAAPAGTSELAAVASAGAYPAAISTPANAAKDAPAADEAAPAPVVADEQLTANQPLKTVQIQITGADDQRVDLKLMEKSGTLSLSVRSGDASLTKALQQNLPDLTSKLNDQQMRAEWWRPEAQATESSSKSGDASANGGGNHSPSQDRGSQNSGNQNQRNSGQQQPDWLEELTAPNKSNQNGTQYSWQL